jgi:hypothetical protein
MGAPDRAYANLLRTSATWASNARRSTCCVVTFTTGAGTDTATESVRVATGFCEGHRDRDRPFGGGHLRGGDAVGDLAGGQLHPSLPDVPDY